MKKKWMCEMRSRRRWIWSGKYKGCETEKKWENIRNEPLWERRGPGPDDSIERLGKDYYFWLAVLRSLSAFEIYRQVYRDEITPQKIAELLVTRKDMHRSLLVCVQNIQKNINRVFSIHYVFFCSICLGKRWWNKYFINGCWYKRYWWYR